MARNPRRRGRVPPKKAASKQEKPEPQEEKRPRKGRREAGSETSVDTHLVNAKESDPEFYRDPLVGQTLGKCEVQKLLGEGRTAVVYRAKYKPLKRTVAVKVLSEHMAEVPSVLRVFQQEGRAVAALDHENVLKIYDVGEDRDRHYLVLELLRGNDLLKLIEEAEGGVLPPEEALDYVGQAAAGLAAAHKKKLVHRDIKPQNLVVEPKGTLKIVDFGLAAEAEGAFSGGRLGTPHYMSPEVCRGEPAGTASDIYSLGITLFHALVGHPPYSGLHTTEEIVAQHLKGERLEPEKARPGLPRSVCELTRRMTRSDPKARPTAQQVLEYLAKMSPDRRAAGRPGRGGRRAARRSESSSRNLFLGMGLVLVVVIVVAVVKAGSGDDKAPDEVRAPPEPEVVVPEPEVERPKEHVDSETRSDLEIWLADARQEEKTGNNIEALRLYHRVLMRAPADSNYYTEAKTAYENLVRITKKEIGMEDEQPDDSEPAPKMVSVEDSESAGKEFGDRAEEFRGRLRTFDIAQVKAEMETYVPRTRIGSAERVAVERALTRVDYLVELLKMAEARASSLAGSKAQWSSYDLMASGDLIVMGADARGIAIKDEASGVEKIRPWTSFPKANVISFLDGLRNPKSAPETLCLGYFCQLLEDPRAAQYFEFAQMLEDTAEMRKQIEELKAD